MIDAIIQWDMDVLLYFQDHIRTAWLDPIMKACGLLGRGGVIWILLCIILMIPKKTRRIGICAGAALALSFIVNNLIIKNVVGRIRPYEVVEGLTRIVDAESDASFPSGHAACVFSVATGVLLSSKNKIPGILLILFGFLMGFSRIYVGVHYPTDVIVAIFVSTASAVLAYLIVCAIEKKLHKRREEREDADAMMIL